MLQIQFVFRLGIKKLQTTALSYSTACPSKKILNIKPPNKKVFNSKDLLKTLSETFPPDPLSVDNPQERIFTCYSEDTRKSKLMHGRNTVSYLQSKYPEFFAMDFIEHSLPGFNSVVSFPESPLERFKLEIDLENYKKAYGMIEEMKHEELLKIPNDYCSFLIAKLSYMLHCDILIMDKRNIMMPAYKILKLLTEVQTATPEEMAVLSYVEKKITLQQNRNEKKSAIEITKSSTKSLFNEVLESYPKNQVNINVINDIILISEFNEKKAEHVAKAMKSYNISPNLSTFNCLLLSVDSLSYSSFEFIGKMLHEMNGLGIIPNLETWAIIYQKIAEAGMNRSCPQFYQLVVDQFNKHLRGYNFENCSESVYRSLYSVVSRWNSAKELNYELIHKVLDQAVEANLPRIYYNYLALFMGKVIKFGTVDEMWKAYNKYVIFQPMIPGFLFGSNSWYRNMLNAVVREEKFEFLPVIWAIMQRNLYQSHVTGFEMWGKIALKYYDNCDEDTKKQLENICTMHLSSSSITRMTKKRENFYGLNLFIQIVVKGGDIIKLMNVLKNVDAIDTNQFQFSPEAYQDCRTLGQKQGNTSFVDLLKANYFKKVKKSESAVFF